MARVFSGLRVLSAGTLLFAAAASASLAPFQCAGEAKPDLRREEEPAEALYGLAEQFKAKGATAARVETLRYILKKYPTSRFAESAQIDLEGLSQPPDESEKAGPSKAENAAASP